MTAGKMTTDVKPLSFSECGNDGIGLHAIASEILADPTACKAYALFQHAVDLRLQGVSEDAVKLAWAFARIAQYNHDRVAGSSALSDGVPMTMRVPAGLARELKKCADLHDRSVEREALGWLISSMGIASRLRQSDEAIEWYEVLRDIAGDEAIGHKDFQDHVLDLRRRSADMRA